MHEKDNLQEKIKGICVTFLPDILQSHRLFFYPQQIPQPFHLEITGSKLCKSSSPCPATPVAAPCLLCSHTAGCAGKQYPLSWSTTLPLYCYFWRTGSQLNHSPHLDAITQMTWMKEWRLGIVNQTQNHTFLARSKIAVPGRIPENLPAQLLPALGSPKQLLRQDVGTTWDRCLNILTWPFLTLTENFCVNYCNVNDTASL